MTWYITTESSPTRYSDEDYLSSAISAAHEDACGTSACAAGWGIVMNIGTDVLDTQADVKIDEYIADAFTGGDQQIYNWLFCIEWSDLDNTALGAAARIRYFLQNDIDDIDDSVYYYKRNIDTYREMIAPYRQKSIEKRIKALARSNKVPA